MRGVLAPPKASGPPIRSLSLTTTVYTDGACLGNPGPGGWAWAVPEGAHASGAEPHTTNQRMEIRAALEALDALPGPLEVVSDSKYVVQCFTDRWYAKWEANGWKTSNRTPVLNQDLWRPLVEAFHAREGELTFRWVKGHSGDVMNDVVDRLATEAARRQVGRSGSEPATDLGEADEPTRSRKTGTPAVAANAAPDGYRVVVLGHRPPDLGGYEENPITTAVRNKLTEILRGLAAIHPDLVVLTGLGLGAEQLGAEAAASADVAYIAVLPFPDPDAVWPATSRATFRLLADAAHDTILLSEKSPTSKAAAGAALRQRNAWLIAHADAALVVWDGHDRSLRDDVKALERKIPDDVWIIDPNT
ncbi:MAG: ribonuclease [Actinomycetota bacterium]|nr:ribonuclease [Actinomycetota bacterium]